MEKEQEKRRAICDLGDASSSSFFILVLLVFFSSLLVQDITDSQISLNSDVLAED